MRIYLRIERHSLRPVKTVWPLSKAQQSWTISQLLEAVDKTFPLEGTHWGLEDYVVTIGDYECIHHHEIADICKEDDELVIRPLQTVEIRARTLSGRHQISIAGRHLVDGIAFGKAALQEPVRPIIHIPPRKRRKLDLEEPEEEDVLMIEGVNRDLQQDLSDSDSADLEYLDHSAQEDDDSEESELSDEEGEEEDSDTSSPDESDAESWKGLNVPSPNVPGGLHGSEQTQKLLEERSRDWEDKDVASTADGTSQPQQPTGIPFEGAEHTRRRNVRRRNQKRLRHLQLAGILPPGSSFAELEAYDQGNMKVAKSNGVYSRDYLEPQIDNEASLDARKQELLDKLAANEIDINTTSNELLDGQEHVDDDTEDAPEQLSSKQPAMLRNGIHAELRDGAAEHNELMASQREAMEAEAGPLENTAKSSLLMIPTTVTARRAKLDLAGSKRMLFASLGVRVPKDAADREKTQAKLAAVPQRKAVNVEPTMEPVSEPDDFEDWQSKIALSAVECWDEDVTLSTPPFPFKQGWDPQYRKQKKRRHRSEPDAALIVPNDNNVPEGDTLNYDENAPEDDGVNNDGAATLLNDAAEDAVELEAGFPPLPKDVDSLPLLDEDSAVAGDYVTYTELICTAATNWQPKWVDRTIQLVEKNDDGWRVKLALRDLPQREYDDEGKRIYSKFETEGMSDDEDNDLTSGEVVWNEISTPRLLLRA